MCVPGQHFYVGVTELLLYDACGRTFLHQRGAKAMPESMEASAQDAQPLAYRVQNIPTDVAIGDRLHLCVCEEANPTHWVATEAGIRSGSPPTLAAPREHEVMSLLVSGLLNKQIASQLEAKEITVKIRRSRVMHKMQAGSLAELVRRINEQITGSFPQGFI